MHAARIGVFTNSGTPSLTTAPIKTQWWADAFLTFHHVNAYVEDGQLVVDACRMEDWEVRTGGDDKKTS